jgi:purine-binding chemotaxis protein CheW
VTDYATTPIGGAVDFGRPASQYLTFLLGEEEYGVDILRVQEIKGWQPVTAIPNTPDYVCGVMNLRGTVIPVVDLRRRFQLEWALYEPTTVVIVVRIESAEANRTMGFVVDAVSEVYNIDSADLQPPPDLGVRVDTKFIHGLAVVDDHLVTLLDFDRLIEFDSVFSADDESTHDLSAPSNGASTGATPSTATTEPGSNQEATQP